MKPLCIGVALALVGVALGPAPALAAAPKLVVAVPIVDVGVVPKGDDIVHEFPIRNEGDADLEITEVKPTCGCTVASFARVIKPGRTGKVKVVLTTSDFSGPIAKSVSVFTNDAGAPKIQLVVKANIRAQIEVEPGYARWVVIHGEDFETSSHVLRTSDEQSFEVLGVDSPFPFLSARAGREGEGEGAAPEWRLELELDDDAPIGPMADFVIVRLDHPRQKQVRIPVSGFVRPPVAVIPQVFDFGRRKLDEPYPGKVLLRVVGPGQVRISEATTDLPGVEAEIEELEPGRRYNVVIRLDPAMTRGPQEGKVTVRTDSDVVPVLEIPVTGTVL